MAPRSRFRSLDACLIIYHYACLIIHYYARIIIYHYARIIIYSQRDGGVTGRHQVYRCVS